MLKIKDNVDLKELERFGFEEKEGSYNFLIEQYEGKIVIKKDRIVKYFEYFYDDYGWIAVGEECMDKLFELFGAGIIEKVGE